MKYDIELKPLQSKTFDITPNKKLIFKLYTEDSTDVDCVFKEGDEIVHSEVLIVDSEGIRYITFQPATQVELDNLTKAEVWGSLEVVE